MFYIVADFGSVSVPWPKLFGIDKDTAKARVNPDWKALLANNITTGKKQRFCCGWMIRKIGSESAMETKSKEGSFPKSVASL